MKTPKIADETNKQTNEVKQANKLQNSQTKQTR